MFTASSSCAARAALAPSFSRATDRRKSMVGYCRHCAGKGVNIPTGPMVAIWNSGGRTPTILRGSPSMVTCRPGAKAPPRWEFQKSKLTTIGQAAQGWSSLAVSVLPNKGLVPSAAKKSPATAADRTDSAPCSDCTTTELPR